MSDGLSGHGGTPRAAGHALVAILLGVSGCAWLLSAWLATPEMRLGVLTGAAMVSARSQMGMQGSTRASAATSTTSSPAAVGTGKRELDSTA